MALSFLIPLFTGLITGYIFKKGVDEIAYFAGILAVISLIISLVLAPWQIQLLLLIVVLITTQILLEKNEYKMKQYQNNQNKINSSS
jgi:membrane protein implicated in regulation of membrane protease activity